MTETIDHPVRREVRPPAPRRPRPWRTILGWFCLAAALVGGAVLMFCGGSGNIDGRDVAVVMLALVGVELVGRGPGAGGPRAL